MTVRERKLHRTFQVRIDTSKQTLIGIYTYKNIPERTGLRTTVLVRPSY